MKRTVYFCLAASATLAGSVLVAPSASAVTEHCDSSLYPNKVELSGSSNSASTGLAPGTEVCIKAGTKTIIVTVDDNGDIYQEGILNKPGNAYLGISYYAYGEEGCVDDPYTYENECDPGSGGS